jgi:hypothetical protein
MKEPTMKHQRELQFVTRLREAVRTAPKVLKTLPVNREERAHLTQYIASLQDAFDRADRATPPRNRK